MCLSHPWGSFAGMDQNTTTPVVPESASPRYAELAQMVADMQADFDKFYAQGNKAAGTRVRQAMQQLKTFAQTVRAEVQEIKNSGQNGSNGA